jgi:hypothetical protein
LRKPLYLLIIVILLAPSLGFALTQHGPYSDASSLQTAINALADPITDDHEFLIESTGYTADSQISYNNWNVDISANGGGTGNYTITIKPETENGAVQFTGASTVFQTSGKYIIWEGFHFYGNDGNLFQLHGASNCTVTQCKFENKSGAGYTVYIGKYDTGRENELTDAQNNTIENCTFTYSSGTSGESVVYIAHRDRAYSTYYHDETNNTGNTIKKSVFYNIDYSGGNDDVIQTGAGSYCYLEINSGDTDPSGNVITGNTSGAQMYASSTINDSGSFGGGDWAGWLTSNNVGEYEGATFQVGETLSVSGDSDFGTVASTIGGGCLEKSTDTGTIIEYNLFEDIALDNETISLKGGGAVVRYNFFKNVDGALTFRTCDNGAAYGNFFYVDDNAALGNRFIRGIRVYGDGNAIYNNYLESVNADSWIDGAYIVLYGGNGGKIRARATNTLVANNTIVSDSRHGVRSFDDDVPLRFRHNI